MKIKSLIKHNLMRAAMTLALILACAAAWAQTVQNVTYIDVYGQPQTVSATPIVDGYTAMELTAGQWYVVSGNVIRDHESITVTGGGAANIILADGAKFTYFGTYATIDGSLNIYGQSEGTGKFDFDNSTGNPENSELITGNLTVYGGEVRLIGHDVEWEAACQTAVYGNVTIYRGSLYAKGGSGNANGFEYNGSDAIHGNVYFYGGNLEARGGSGPEMNGYGIQGNINLSWSSTSDRFFCDRHNDSNSITIEANKFFVDEENTIHSSANVGNIDSHTLQPLTGLHQNGDVYTICDATGWDFFCDALQDNDTYNRFSGKTVKLEADISVTRMAGSSQHDFCGTFDGQGHTLTVDYGTAESPITADKAAPFVNVESGCIIENLHVAGDIYTSGKNAAGIAGTQYGAVTIRNCRVSTAIHSYTIGDGTHGGLVGNNGNGNGSALSIEGCVFDGKLLTEGETVTIKCGGFVGWHSSERMLTISNSLFAPTEVTIGTTSSATFARNGATITNCYYTTDFNDGEHFTAQGKQARSITADNYVTVANAGTATTYSTSGITSYGTGILYDNVLYAGNGDEVSLTLSNSIGGDVPEGYQYAYSTNAGTLDGSTLTMPDANVSVSTALRSTGQPVDGIGYYINNGNAFTEAIALDGTESSLGNGGETWYFVGTDISHSGYILCYGNVNIILADGKTMTITSSYDVGIYVNGSLTIYGQDYITGTLNVNSNYTGIYSYSGSGNITISGGTVNATGNNPGGIYSIGDITISDSRVTATGGSYGIRSNGNITIGCAYASDFIYASSYVVGSEGTLNIADGKTFKDVDGQTYRGTIAKVNGAYPIDGKRLYPDCVAMKQVEGYDNGDGGWVFIASPVGDIAPSEVHNLIATTEEDYDLYRFNQSDANGNEWQNWKATTTENHPDFTSLVNGQGYLYATKEDRTLVFSGEYPSGTYPVEVPLDYDENADLAGWNLVGNPFEVEAYVDRPFYKMNDEGTGIVPVVNDFNSYTPITIPSCTGIMVHTTADEVTQGTNKVTFSTTAPAQQTTNKGSLQIALSQVTSSLRGTKQSSTLDNAIISFNEGSKLSKFYFGTQNANIYIPQDNEEYAIAFSESQGEMPLNFKAKENGTYTLTVSTTLNSQLSTLNYLHLIDNLTGADVDLLVPEPVEGPASYTFTAKTTDYESRFKLVFSADEDVCEPDEAFAFISNGNIIVNGIGTLQVFDILGHQLITKQLSTLNSKLSTLNYKSGVYVLRLINGENVRTQKMVIE